MDPNARPDDVNPEEDLALTRRPDGNVVIDDAALGDWSTNPDFQQPPDEDSPVDH